MTTVKRFPDWIVPMAATLTQERFTGADWTFERKYDGIRLLAFKQGPEVRLLSRNRLGQDRPGLAAAVAALPVDQAILDGEMSWDGETFHVFDVMWLDGDTTELPLVQRRALLQALPLRPPLERVEEVAGPAPWERAAREGWEGVIAKRLDSRYEQRRSPLWLKMKCEVKQALVIGGFTDPRGSRVGLGALLVGYFDGAELVFAGKVGTGLDTKLLLELRGRLDALALGAPPFTRGAGLPRQAHWARPELVVEVAFIEWTGHGKLRHPRLLAVRSDLPPQAARR
jgi:bifunctional non-homologous end joining protein LigD